MRGCLIWIIAIMSFMLFGGIIIATLGFALYVIELLLPIAIIVVIVLLLIKLITGKSPRDIFSSKEDKRHRYRRRK